MLFPRVLFRYTVSFFLFFGLCKKIMMEKEKDASVYFFLFFQLVLLHRKQLRENVSHQGLPVRKSVKINPTERVVMNASSH